MKISKVNTVVISDEPQSIKNVTTSVKSIMLLRKKIVKVRSLVPNKTKTAL